LSAPQILKLTALVKARLLFADEIRIADHAENKIFSEDFLENLIIQKNKMISQRDNMLKSFVFLVFSIYLVSNGSSINVPGFGISLNQIPGLLILLFLVCPIFAILWSMCHISVQGYDALIDQIIIAKKSDYTTIDPDIIKAAYEPYWFFLKLYRNEFNIYEQNRFAISSAGSFSNAIAMFGVGFVMTFCLFVPILYLMYAVSTQTASDLFGWAVRIYSYVGIFISILILLLEYLEFKHEVRTVTSSKGPVPPLQG
jgi:hypothetical protein